MTATSVADEDDLVSDEDDMTTTEVESMDDPPAAMDDDTPSEGPPDGPRAPRVRLAAKILTAVVLLGVVAVALTGWWAWSAHRQETAGAEAVQAARQVALNLTTIDSGSVDADLARLLDSATGEFRDEFAGRADPFTSIVRDAEVSTTGEVVEAGLKDLSGDTANVLLAVRSQVRNSQTTEPEQRNYRLAVTMRHQDGRWLASNVEFVP